MTSKTTSTIRAGNIDSAYPKQGAQRIHGRITKEDIRSAGLRRWNGRSRITTDWFNLYQEPELCFPNGDLLVYLRQPGQSSRGPAFRVHTSVLRERGFYSLLESCVSRPALHPKHQCLLNSCPGCDRHASNLELYIPAPFTTSIDAIFDHHITTRNFFAWLYDLPLAGRALGTSFVALKGRIDQYRQPRGDVLNKKEVIAFAESQKYLDYRECVDHALAALHLAEHLQQEDMWIDAFAHTVGMSHREMTVSLEYAALTPMTRALIMESRLEMDVRLARASMSIETFFGDDLSGNFLGLSQAARDHFDRFRSFLHGFYIERYGFWPPAGFSAESSRYSIYTSLYADFRNLYHHLVDGQISANGGEEITSTGGVCTVQNIAAFDVRNGFETLPRPFPRLPKDPDISLRPPISHRRRSWNPVAQKRIERETKQESRKQALIDGSNRDLMLMNCRLVREYSEFEIRSVTDNLEQVSWLDGRKVRWILVYAILQTLISIMAAPKHVRNTEGLSYSLCCHIPTKLPWTPDVPPKYEANSQHKEIVPDIDYRQDNSSTSSLGTWSSRVTDRKQRRMTLPAQSNIAEKRSTSVPRVASLKRLLSKRRGAAVHEAPPMPTLPSRAHCEILVHGYGNGLNEVQKQGEVSMTFPSREQLRRRGSLEPNVVPDGAIFQKEQLRIPHDGDEDIPALTPSSSASVSRETSNASTASAKSNSTSDSIDVPTPTDNKEMKNLVDALNFTAIDRDLSEKHTYDEIEGLPGSIHIDTKAWDAMLA